MDPVIKIMLGILFLNLIERIERYEKLEYERELEEANLIERIESVNFRQFFVFQHSVESHREN